MPTKLPNGLLIYNMTPHVLRFDTEEGELIAPSDGKVDAVPETYLVEDMGIYQLTRVRFIAIKSNVEMMQRIKEKNPDAVIVGSMIAAKAYPKLMVYGVPLHRGDRKFRNTIIRSDRFATFRKVSTNNG